MDGKFGPDLAAVISVLQTGVLWNSGDRCVIPEIGVYPTPSPVTLNLFKGLTFSTSEN
jgi:hypothetical protein